MQASLVKRGKFYSAVVITSDIYGGKKQKWISTKCEKKADAKKVLHEIIQDMENGNFTSANKILFCDFAKDWLETIIINKVEQNTYASYVQTMNRHILPYFAQWKNLYLSDMKPLHVQKYCKDKLAEVSGNTIHKHAALISGIFKYAMKMDLVSSNIVERVELPKKTPFDGKFYTVDQLKAIMCHVSGKPLEPVIVLSAYYGLRRSEVLGLKWSDIDFENNILYVQRSRVIAGNDIIDKATKTVSSTRSLPLLPVVKIFLLDLQQKTNRFMPKGMEFSEYICCQGDGKPVRPDYVTKTFKNLIRDLGFPETYRFHDLRHTVATILVKHHMSINQVKDWMGHNDIKTTLHYAHLDAEMKMAPAGIMNDFLD